MWRRARKARSTPNYCRRLPASTRPTSSRSFTSVGDASRQRLFLEHCHRTFIPTDRPVELPQFVDISHGQIQRLLFEKPLIDQHVVVESYAAAIGRDLAVQRHRVWQAFDDIARRQLDA